MEMFSFLKNGHWRPIDPCALNDGFQIKSAPFAKELRIKFGTWSNWFQLEGGYTRDNGTPGRIIIHIRDEADTVEFYPV